MKKFLILIIFFSLSLNKSFAEIIYACTPKNAPEVNVVYTIKNNRVFIDGKLESTALNFKTSKSSIKYNYNQKYNNEWRGASNLDPNWFVKGDTKVSHILNLKTGVAIETITGSEMHYDPRKKNIKKKTKVNFSAVFNCYGGNLDDFKLNVKNNSKVGPLSKVGYGSSKVDYNFKCRNQQGMNRNYGFKKFSSKNLGKQVFLVLPLLNKGTYGMANSLADNFGSQKINGTQYDSMYAWYHDSSGNNIYYISKYVLLVKGNKVSLSQSIFETSSSLNKPMRSIIKKYDKMVQKDFEKAVEILSQKNVIAVKTLNPILEKSFITTSVYNCTAIKG
tara:strand:+ start:302 stop:1300 length:999 start_codon:yes stop_codon:yes gene_type:complete